MTFKRETDSTNLVGLLFFELQFVKANVLWAVGQLSGTPRFLAVSSARQVAASGEERRCILETGT